MILYISVSSKNKEVINLEKTHHYNTVKNIFKICYHNIFSFVKST